MAKLRMVITVDFDAPTQGVFAEWASGEQCRGIASAARFPFTQRINDFLAVQGVMVDGVVSIDVRPGPIWRLTNGH